LQVPPTGFEPVLPP